MGFNDWAPVIAAGMDAVTETRMNNQVAEMTAQQFEQLGMPEATQYAQLWRSNPRAAAVYTKMRGGAGQIFNDFQQIAAQRDKQEVLKYTGKILGDPAVFNMKPEDQFAYIVKTTGRADLAANIVKDLSSVKASGGKLDPFTAQILSGLPIEKLTPESRASIFASVNAGKPINSADIVLAKEFRGSNKHEDKVSPTGMVYGYDKNGKPYIRALPGSPAEEALKSVDIMTRISEGGEVTENERKFLAEKRNATMMDQLLPDSFFNIEPGPDGSTLPETPRPRESITPEKPPAQNRREGNYPEKINVANKAGVDKLKGLYKEATGEATDDVPKLKAWAKKNGINLFHEK